MGKGKKHHHTPKGQSSLPYSAPATTPTTGGKAPTKEAWRRCYHDHPPYEIAPGLTIYGGSCLNPAVDDADVYIGFDQGMKPGRDAYPWTPRTSFLFKIDDMHTPTDQVEFDKLLDWTAEQLKAGKKVHAGCIGGHGRTGLFFAALRHKLTGDKDAITHVRTNYCKKTVESVSQVKWLGDHYEQNPVEATKGGGYMSDWQSGVSPSSFFGGGGSKPSSNVGFWKGPSTTAANPPPAKSTGAPTNRPASIWGA